MKDIAIHFESHGKGRPIVVLHGTPLDHRSVEAALEPTFAEHPGWKRIYPDLPGHGKSPAPDSIQDADGMLDVVMAFIDSVVPGERFVLVGESYGGYLARGVVHHWRDRVDGLMLWTPANYPRSERKLPPRTVRRSNPALAAGLATETEQQMFAVLVDQTEEAVDFQRSFIVPAAAVANEAFLDRVVDTRFSFVPEDREFGKPTLIVAGRQDWVVGYADAYRLVEHYPRGTFVVADGAGHALGFGERRALFRVLVDEWLDELEDAAET
jgi:pimeloyl-ACP methyl ester carboxylesterase